MRDVCLSVCVVRLRGVGFVCVGVGGRIEGGREDVRGGMGWDGWMIKGNNESIYIYIFVCKVG